MFIPSKKMQSYVGTMITVLLYQTYEIVKANPVQKQYLHEAKLVVTTTVRCALNAGRNSVTAA